MTDLISVADAAALIESGKPMLVAGDAQQLLRLPKGLWIGGTTPCFMTKQGGVIDRGRVFVTVLEHPVNAANLCVYSKAELHTLTEDYPRNGCSFVILPVESPTHVRFARECTTWPGLFNSPLVGWNAGVFEGTTDEVPLVFDGSTSRCFDDAAVVLHAELPPSYVARVEIINPFQQGDGDQLTFPSSGTTVRECLVNGHSEDFVSYLERKGVDLRWPLVADYAGAKINVSFQQVETHPRCVRLYAPVFEGVEYKLAKPVADVAEFFSREFAAHRAAPSFSCNCILNFLHAELHGKKTGEAVGPITFGEIAYMQLNQTLVYVTFESTSDTLKNSD